MSASGIETHVLPSGWGKKVVITVPVETPECQHDFKPQRGKYPQPKAMLTCKHCHTTISTRCYEWKP